MENNTLSNQPSTLNLNHHTPHTTNPTNYNNSTFTLPYQFTIITSKQHPTNPYTTYTIKPRATIIT